MIVLNIVLMALIGAAIVGFMVWSILTQHRHYGCPDIRIRRRPQASVKRVSPEEPELVRLTTIAPQI